MPNSAHPSAQTWQEHLLQNLQLVFNEADLGPRTPDHQALVRQVTAMLPGELPPDAPLPPELETRLHEFFERELRSVGLVEDVEPKIHQLLDSFKPAILADIYPSFEQLRSLHLDLLRRQRAEGLTPELLSEIHTLVQRGAPTGVVIDAESDRDYAQSLLNYWTTFIISQGHPVEHVELAEFDPDLAPEIPDELSPYRGLNAFSEADSNVFFGRQKQIDELVQLVKSNSLVAVVGASGSGKSSLVRAGLIPQLKQHPYQGSPAWVFMPPIVPGSHPLENLAALFRPAEIPLKTWTAQASVDLETDPQKVVLMVAERLGKDVFVVVDQFEETFTLCDSPSEQQAFCAALLALARSPEHQHRVLVTMRTDFYEERLPLVPEFQQAAEAARLILTPLTPTELRQVIEEPAHKIGLKFEEGVVDRLLQDILGEPAALPLLQFTLQKLWQNRHKNRITLETYKKLGGGRKALERSADEFYSKLIREDKDAVRAILLKLVRPGAGLEVTSRRVRRAELFIKTYASDRIERVLDRLIKENLLRLTPGATPEDDQVEVAHEALVRNWSTLINWLDDERVTLRQRQRLTSAAEHWGDMGETPDLLLRGVELDEAMRYDDMNPLETRFVEASQALRSAEEQKTIQEALRLRKRNQIITLLGVLAFLVAIIAVYQSWQANLQATIANEQRATVTFAQGTLEAINVQLEEKRLAAETASTAAVIESIKAQANSNLLATEKARAEQSREEAEQEARKNKQSSIIFQSVSAQNTDYSRALLLGVEALNMQDNFEGRSNILSALKINPSLLKYLHQGVPGITHLIASPDGQLLVGRDNDGVLFIWDYSLPSRPALLSSFSVLSGSEQLIFRPGTRTLVVANPSEVVLFDLTDPTNPQSTSAGFLPGNNNILNLSFTTDGQLLAVATSFNIVIYNLGSSQLLGQPSYLPNPEGTYLTGAFFKPGPARNLAVSYGYYSDSDGRDLGEIHFWDVTDPQIPFSISTTSGESESIPAFKDIVRDMAFAPDGSYLVTGSCARWDVQGICQEGELRFIDTRDLSAIRLASLNNAHTENITSLVFDPSGRKLISTSFDRSAILWTAGDPNYVYTAKVLSNGHKLEVSAAAFSQDGEVVATGGADGQVILWNAGATSGLDFSYTTASYTSWVWNAVYHPTKPLVATKNNGGPLQIWNVQDPQNPYKLFETNDPSATTAWKSAFHPRGNLLAVVGQSGISLWDIRLPQKSIRLPDPPEGRMDGTTLAFNQDGSLLAATDREGQLYLWDFSQPDAPAFISKTSFTDLPIAAYGSAFRAADNTLVIADEFGEITILNLSDPSQPVEVNRFKANQAAQPANETGIYAMSLSQDGNLMVVSGCLQSFSGGDCTQGFFRLWNIANPAQPFPLSSPVQVHGLNAYANALSSDGLLLATSGNDGIVLLWDLASPANPRRILAEGLAHTPWINYLAFSADDRQLVAASDDGSFTLWNTSQPGSPSMLSQNFTTLAGDMTNFTASADRTRIAASIVRADFVTPPIEDFIALWQVNQKLPPSLVAQFAVGGTGDISSLAMRPDGQVLASGTNLGNLRIWDIANLSIPQLLNEPRQNGTSLISLAFSPDGLWLAAADDNRRIILWDVSDPARPLLVERVSANKPITAGTLTFNPSGNLLAAGACGLGSAPCAQGSILLWTFDAQGISRLSPQPETWAHEGFVNWLVFHPTLPVLVSIGDDTQAILWDIKDPSKLVQLSQVTNPQAAGIFSLTFSADAAYMLSYSTDGAFNLWDAQDLKSLQLFKEPLGYSTSYNYGRSSGNVYLTNLSGTAGGSQNAIMLDDRSLTVLDMQPGTWIARACQVANRNLTYSEWSQLNPNEEYRATCPQLPSHPSVAQVYIAEGNLLAQAGQREQAVERYRLALEIDPTLMADPEQQARQVQVQYTLNEGYRLAYADQYDLAKEFFILAKALDPNLDLDPDAEIDRIYSDTLLNQAYDLAYQNDSSGAREKFEQALAVNPQVDPSIEQSLAENIIYNIENMLYSMQDDQSLQVADIYAMMVDFEQTWGYSITAFDWYLACWNGSLNNQAAEALPTCEEAVERSADPSLAAGGRGLAYAINGDTQLALDDFSTFLDNHLENPEIAYQVSIIQELVDALKADNLDSILKLAEALRYNYYYITDKPSLTAPAEPVILPTSP